MKSFTSRESFTVQVPTAKKVMIVDDQIFNIKALRIILELLHLKPETQIVEAMNGLEAV